jgi:hypothetical protein
MVYQVFVKSQFKFTGMDIEMVGISKSKVHDNEGKLEANSKEELKPFLEEECPNEVVTTDEQKSPTVSLKGNLHKCTYFVQ